MVQLFGFLNVILLSMALFSLCVVCAKHSCWKGMKVRDGEADGTCGWCKVTCRNGCARKVRDFRYTHLSTLVNIWSLFWIETLFELCLITALSVYPYNHNSKTLFQLENPAINDYFVIVYLFFILLMILTGFAHFLYYTVMFPWLIKL